MTKLELTQRLADMTTRALAAEGRAMQLTTQLEAERTHGRANVRAAAKFQTLKEEYLSRTREGESVVISNGRVWLTEELRKQNAVVH